MIKSIVITTVSGLLIQFGMHWLPRLFPYHPPPGATRWSLEQLKRLYARVDHVLIYPMAIGMVGLPFVWYVLFMGWRYFAYPNPGTPGMIITPSWLFWTAVAILGGAMTLVVAWHSILRRILGRRYGEYCVYKKWESGRALPVLFKAFKISNVAILIIAFYSLSATYTLFRSDRIIIAKPYGKTVSFRYYDIVEVRAVKRQSEGTKKRSRNRYEIEFYDGTVWHAGVTLNFTDPCTTFPYIAFAAERSRRPITGPDLYAEEGCKAS